MPGKNFEPETEHSTKDSTLATESQVQPVRELTQTDRLNKRLLQSFLERLNQSSVPIPAMEPLQQNNTNDTENDFA